MIQNRLFRALLILFTVFLSGKGCLNAQTYLYFQDSPVAGYYDYSWMELTAPSVLERMGTDLRKFPVESTIASHQGTNCLRLKWTSKTGGGWFAIAAGTGWSEKDISTADTLMFWLYSVEGIAATDLPKVFFEDITNHKSNFQALDPWTADLPAGVWKRVALPISVFTGANDGTDFTTIKTIGFTQSTADDVQHTLLVDDMRVFTGDGTFPQATVPDGVKATGYECHIEVSWDFNPETSLNGYQVERSTDGGTTFTTLKYLDKNTNIYVDWVKPLGIGTSLTYRVRAVNGANESSDPSVAVTASTHEMNDEEFLDMVELYTFRYFWNFAEPNSGMNRDRNSLTETVTSGGSGFGVMAIIVGIERGYITREQGVERILKILNYLETSDRFHGAFPHFMSGKTGKVVPFSTKDNGGDLVETAFMIQGLLAARQYFTGNNTGEESIVTKCTSLWESVEWDWYRQNNQNVLYWHWSPTYAWQMNMQIRGWNEAAIVYLLGMASPTHSIPATLWKQGWAGNSNYKNGRTFFGHKIFVGWDYGGPLFFAHYSFLGFDPRNKADNFTNYFDNNRNIALIHQAYCVKNPLSRAGYSESCWGMTASDDPSGYAVHEPTSGRDNGTISPTAALSSFPYTPDESMLALKYFYRQQGAKTWGWMGFYDAFNLTKNWYATSYLAIDQGPIIIMIENYRTQLLWNLFMANPEIQPMMDAAGFHTQADNIRIETAINNENIYPNPVSRNGTLTIELKQSANVNLVLYDVNGRKIADICKGERLSVGMYTIYLSHYHIPPGMYVVEIRKDSGIPENFKLIIQ
jgi:hypothetical protein